MRRRHLRMKRWIAALAVLAVLSFAASASAMPADLGAGGRAVNSPAAVPATGGSDGFNWWYAAVGVGAALGVAVAGTAIVQANGHRRRLEGLAH